jgi:HK97 family phage major capsid protein
VSTRTPTQQAREVARAKGQLAMLEAAGIDPSQVGRVFNRANVATVEIEDIPIPRTAAELEAMMGDNALMAKIQARPALFGEFIQNYARTVHEKDMSISAQVKEQVQAELAAMVKAGDLDAGDVNRPDLRPRMGGSGQTSMAGQNVLYNARAIGASLDKDFSSASDFFQTIWHNTHKTPDVQNKLSRLRNAFSSAIPSEGGFLIPEQIRSELLRVSLESSIVRGRARVIPMETLRVPFPAIDATSNVSSVYGGVVGYWTEEGAALTNSSASFGRIVLDAKKLTAYTEIPNELISDSIGSFEAFLNQIFPEALSFYEDIAFLKGTGVGEPLGVLSTGNAAKISVSAEAGQAAGTIVWENVVKMFARMLPGSLDRAVWVCSIDTFPELATMALSVGTGGSAIWLNNGVQGPPMTILGRPVIFTEKTPGVLGTVGDINFVDFGFYLIGDRQAMSAMSSPHFKFQNDQTAYRIIERLDGRPWLQSAITPQNNGATLSPFVQLATR